jgi:plasmid stabilization system protein ParE
MSFAVHIAPKAWSDADNIFAWIAARAPAGASRWYSAFLSAAHDLSSNPDRFGVAPESEILGRPIRQRFFKTRRGRTYRILFVVHQREVIVLRIRGPGQPPVTTREIEGTS